MLRSVLTGLATTAALVVTEDTYFAGQSPPVYPSPQQDATGAWADAISKAKDLVSQLTLEEKVNLTSGVATTTGCSGFIGALPRLGFPGLCLNNAGNGVGATNYVSAFTSGIHVAASWNNELAYDRAWHMGLEARTMGVNILLGPVVGPVGRVVQGDRNWEGSSPDPCLSGQLVHETVVGTQDTGVMTSTKYFLAHEQEGTSASYKDKSHGVGCRWIF